MRKEKQEVWDIIHDNGLMTNKEQYLFLLVALITGFLIGIGWRFCI